MSQTAPSATALRVADFSTTAPNTFEVRPDAAGLAEITQSLGLLGLRKLRFAGQITPMGKTDWQLDAQLGATAIQACVVTLDPVTTRIDSAITRRFLADYSDPDDPEVEMPEDDSTDRLGAWIDPAVIMIEALALALPDYPRKDDAALTQRIFTKPGDAPMTDADARPFAGLANLRDALKSDSDET